MATTAHRELHAPVPSDGYVQSFARGLEVIRSFSADAPEQTLSEVAARSGLTRAGARRFLLTLQTLAYVEGDGKHYRLTPRILDLGFAYLTSMPIWNLAEPVMERLSDALGESCSAAVLDGSDIVYVMRVHTHKIMSTNLGIGSGLVSAAAPVKNRAGKVVAALNASWLANRTSATAMKEQLLPKLRTAADDVSALLSRTIRT